MVSIGEDSCCTSCCKNIVLSLRGALGCCYFVNVFLIIGTFRSENEYDFSNPGYNAFALDCHILLQTESLLFNWSPTGRNEGSKNVTGLKFESRTRTPI